MLYYTFRRVQLGIVAILIVSLFVFVAIRLSGDAALLMVAQDATEQELRAVREQLGLERSLPVQYALFLERAFLHGDFGVSLRYGSPAMDIVIGRLPATMQLALAAFAVSLVLGVVLGVVAALRQERIADHLLRSVAILGQATPNFWLGMMLILLFAVQLGWLPTSGRSGPASMVLPVATLASGSVAAILRLTRSAMIAALGSEHIRFLRMKGTPERIVVWKHALRNALVPVVAMAGMQLGFLLGGTLIVEVVFGWPGVGTLMLDAVNARDYALIQASVFVTSAFLILLNLLVDLLFGVIDPRITYR